MPTYIHHGEGVDTKPVILAVVTTKTVIWDAVAVVTAALLPGAVLRLPAMRTITLPSSLLDAYLSRAPLLGRPVILLLTLLPLLILLLHYGSPLTLLPLLILLPLGLLLLSGRAIPLLLLLPSGLLLFCRIVLLTLLPLLIPLPLSLLLLSGRVVPLLLLPSCLLLLLFRSLSLLLLVLLLLSRRRGLLLPFGLGLLLLFLRFGLFILLLLPGVRRSTHSH